MPPKLTLTLSPDRLAVCRLDAGAAVPAWAVKSAFFSITRTGDELSIVCGEDAAPNDAALKIERGWRAFKIEGPLDFELTGVLVAVAKPLADAGIPIFALSTYDTDYVLVKHDRVQPAITALARADHTVNEPLETMLVKFGWRLPNNTRFNAHFQAQLRAYEREQDRWIVTLDKLLWITEGMPAAVTERVAALAGKWARVPNEARFGMTLPLKFETLAGRIKFFYDADPREMGPASLAPSVEPKADPSDEISELGARDSGLGTATSGLSTRD